MQARFSRTPVAARIGFRHEYQKRQREKCGGAGQSKCSGNRITMACKASSFQISVTLPGGRLR